MTQISHGEDIVTLINVFTVTPENQQHLLDLLVVATETVMNKLPGFVAANLHKSLDGTRVVNYAQWRSKEAFKVIRGYARGPGGDGAYERLQELRRSSSLTCTKFHLSTRFSLSREG